VGNWLDYAFEVGRGSQSAITNNIISGNIGVATVDGSTSAGILVTSYFNPETPSGATITGNTITNSTDGIAVGYNNTDASVVVAHNNKLTGNVYGVNSTHPLVNATSNWWGSPTGPKHSSNPGGTGDAVSDNVDYSPWCTDENCSEGALGSNDPLDHIVLQLTPSTVTIPGSSDIKVTSKDAAGITRVNETAQVSLSVDGGATIVGGNFYPGFVNGVATAAVTSSVAGTVNVGATAGGKTATGQVVFTTLPGDTTAPVVKSQNPASNSTDVAINVSPTVTFSEAMDANTVNSSTVKLKRYDDDSLVSAVISLDDTRTVAMIDPVSNLLNSTKYYIWVSGARDLAGNMVKDYTSKDNQAFTTGAESVTLAVTGISATQSLATADDTWEHGWHWTFNVTVPTVESSLSMQFSDWMGSAGVIPVAGNTRFYSAQSDHADAAHAVIITTANTYTGPIILTGDLDPATPGRQIQVMVETKVPAKAAGGSYSASYGVRTSTP
jgi:hypothetical protein